MKDNEINTLESETEFYSNVEEPIREIVRTLRDNGINTTSSCGHKMYIEADIIPDGQLYRIHKTVFDYLSKNRLLTQYSIDIHLEQENPLTRCFAVITINK